MFAQISLNKISYHFPKTKETNADLAAMHPDWDVDKVASKTGIYSRYIAGEEETALDLATHAVNKLFAEHQVGPSEIDAVIMITQSPEYVLPTSACILQERAGLRKDILAFDINLGCSGFVNGLAVASGLISSGSVNNCLLVCAETYSKYIADDDRTNKMIFSDAAAACLVEKDETDNTFCGGYEFGTDGGGAHDLIVRGQATRKLAEGEDNHLYMHGSNVLMFTMREIPVAIEKSLTKADLSIDDIDLVIFHQASNLVLDTLTSKLKIDPSKVFNNLAEIGNTVSCTIPIALKDALDAGKITPGSVILLAGFGVGLSWGTTIVKWGNKC